MATTEPIRDKRQIRALCEHFTRRGEYRNYVLIVMGVHTALRVSDLLRLRWNDVYDFERRVFRSKIALVEQKTGKQKTVALNREIIAALKRFRSRCAASPNGFLFESRRRGAAISRIQAYRVIRAAAEELAIGRVSCHSLRKTFGYHAWKSGIAAAVIMEIYNHNSFAVTRRYLGVSQDDKDCVYLGLRLIV